MTFRKFVEYALGLALVFLLLVALFGGDLLWSYWQGAKGVAQQSLRDATSIEFDLQRLDQSIDDLTPTLNNNRLQAAELDVEIEFLAEDTAEMEDKQNVAKAEMAEMVKQLDQQKTPEVVITGQSYPRKKVEADLERRIKDYQKKEVQLQRRRDLIESRRRTLTKVVETISKDQEEQENLRDQADSLDTELKLHEIASTTSDLNLHDPAFAKARQLQQEIHKRLETLKRSTDYADFESRIDVDLEGRSVKEQYQELFPNNDN